VITLRGVGHGAAPFIEGSYGLARFVQEFADGQPRPRFEEEGKLATLPAVVARLYEASETRRHGDVKSAERLARMAVELAPEVEAPRYLLGLILEDLKRWQEAARHLALVAEAAPHFGGAHMHLANCERKFGRLERAIAAYRSYIALKPEGAIAHYWVGRLQLQMGQAEGIESLRRAAELEPENPRFSLDRAQASALSAAKLASSTSPVLTNDASGSSVGLIWCTPFEGALGGSVPYTHIQVEHVDPSKDFRGEKPSLNPGTYLIASFALDEQRGWLRLEFLVDDVAHRAALPKQGVSFRLLRQPRA